MTTIKSDPTLLAEVRKYGKFDPQACYQCGSCSVACTLTTEESASFPRKIMRYILFGLRKLSLSSLDPWLCYYCGDCSTACPRETEPGETMMTLRRFLTAKYDWTGISAKMFSSKVWQISALIASGLFMAALILLFHGPVITDRVELNTFAPAHLVHQFDVTVAFLVSFILFTNAFRMYWFAMHQSNKVNPLVVIKGIAKNGFGFISHKDKKIKIPLRLFITQAWQLGVHAATQKKFLSCSNKSRWIKHFLLVTGYVIMFSLVVVFLEWFQTDEIYPVYHPQRWVGYYATIVLVWFTLEIIIGRLKKREEIHKFSDFSDWMFPILLCLMALTGIAVHIFRLLGFPMATYYMYAVHLIIAFSWLVVIIPFGKWTHLLYRTLALYFQAVKEKALQLHLAKEGT
jgi:quinone-modifying oxidoreductase subunit QmoC